MFGSEHGAMAYPGIWRDSNTLRVQRHRERERTNDTDWQATPELRRVICLLMLQEWAVR
jgi:hypothetical protein